MIEVNLVPFFLAPFQHRVGAYMQHLPPCLVEHHRHHMAATACAISEVSVLVLTSLFNMLLRIGEACLSGQTPYGRWCWISTASPLRCQPAQASGMPTGCSGKSLSLALTSSEAEGPLLQVYTTLEW